ncbi:MAG TPA: urease accessory protein UreE [Xanthobacteraceae bacterium]|nr:urease accessory protein UreE [Xanthobacteraceae bacterium]
MIRATHVLHAGTWDRTEEVDTVELPHDERHRRRIAMRGKKDTVFLLDLPEATILRDGDGLALADGRIVRVVSAIEPVVEIGGNPHLLARVAWHLGNRHVPAQILPDRIRIGRDHVLEKMAKSLGAQVLHNEAPFEPESGAYMGRAAHDHAQAHTHDNKHHRGSDHDQ